MQKSSILYIAFGFMIIFGALHLIAQPLSLYWTYWWFDIMMHFLGGFSGGLLVLWYLGPSRSFQVIFITISCVLIVGIAWEIFEFVFELTQPIDYWQDTAFDIVNDIVGAVIAYFFISLQTPKS